MILFETRKLFKTLNIKLHPVTNSCNFPVITKLHNSCNFPIIEVDDSKLDFIQML